MCKCYECEYLGLNNNEGKFYCNFGDSEHYQQEVSSDDGCDDGDEN